MPVECELVGDDDQDVAVVRAALDLLGLIFLVDAMLESIQNAYASPSACNQDRYASTSDLGGTFRPCEPTSPGGISPWSRGGPTR
jgi:hypothetical protein